MENDPIVNQLERTEKILYEVHGILEQTRSLVEAIIIADGTVPKEIHLLNSCVQSLQEADVLARYLRMAVKNAMRAAAILE